MKKLFTLLFFIIPLLCPFRQAQTEEKNDEWYPFVIPAKLNPNSPANIGKLVLDAPAGKHGFCKVKEGHFYFEDGTRAKFWGTNFCFNACFPTHEQAVILADRLAFFGFNAVRLHHMDFAFEPKGIFEDVCPAFKNPQMKKTGILSKNQLKKLDYLIYQLKIRGIYININLLVSRHFTLADGVIDADKLGQAAKPISMFDAKLIELQKQYAKNLLTHYNPYTKLRYCDDPAIALVEITNENSLEAKGEKNIPKYYRDELNKRFETWQNNSSGSKKEFFRVIEKDYFNQMMKFLKNTLNIKVPITGSQYSNAITQGACDYIDGHAYWDHPTFPSNKWDKNAFRIHNKSALADKNNGLVSNIIQKERNAFKDYVGSNKPFTISEWNHCYPNQYAYETPVMLAKEAKTNNWDGLFQFSFSHGWKVKPEFGNIQSFFECFPNAQQLILLSVGSMIYLADKKIQPVPIKDASAFIINKNESEKILFIVGNIKNNFSGWKNGKFNWGREPTLLKKISISLPFQVIPLRSNGSQEEELITNLTTHFPWYKIEIN